MAPRVTNRRLPKGCCPAKQTVGILLPKLILRPPITCFCSHPVNIELFRVLGTAIQCPTHFHHHQCRPSSGRKPLPLCWLQNQRHNFTLGLVQFASSLSRPFRLRVIIQLRGRLTNSTSENCCRSQSPP